MRMAAFSPHRNRMSPPATGRTRTTSTLSAGIPPTGSFVGKPFSPRLRGRVSGVTISRRITTSDGRFGGIVVMGVRLAAFRELLRRHELRPDELVMLLRDDGLVLMRLPFDLKDIGHHVEPPAPFYLLCPRRAAAIHGRRPEGPCRAAVCIPSRRYFAAGRERRHDRSSRETSCRFRGGSRVERSRSRTMLALAMRRLWREKRRREAAQRESQEKSRFLTTLSHELRTPLHGVLGHADQLLSEGKLDPAQSRQVAEIVRAGEHMRDVVDLALDYARIEALGPALHMRRIDVRQLVEECMAFVEPEARVRGLETRITVAPGAPTQFVTDEVQVRQILVNLLSNAVKYTSQGTVELRLIGDEEPPHDRSGRYRHRHTRRTSPSSVQGIRTVWNGAHEHRGHRAWARDRAPAGPVHGWAHGPSRQPGRGQRLLAGTAGCRCGCRNPAKPEMAAAPVVRAGG